MLAVALEHVCVVEGAKHRDAAARIDAPREDLMIEPLVEQVSVNELVAQVHGRTVVGHDRHVGMVAGEGLAQGEGRPAARGAKDDAVLGKGIDALVDALGHRFVVGQQGEVHVGRDELDG